MAFPTGQIKLLDMILKDLSLAGQPYTAVVTVPEFQINIPLLGVSFTDQDVILVRTDLLTSNALTYTSNQGYYNALVPLPAFPPYLPTTTYITRGWASVDANLNETAFRFITTHLEDGTISPIFALYQLNQEIELIGGPASTAPVIIAGDFNTIANDPSSLTFFTYSLMLLNGFTDAWTTAHPVPPLDVAAQPVARKT